MVKKAIRLVPVLAVLGTLVSTVVPFAPAQAQWVFVARKALGSRLN